MLFRSKRSLCPHLLGPLAYGLRDTASRLRNGSSHVAKAPNSCETEVVRLPSPNGSSDGVHARHALETELGPSLAIGHGKAPCSACSSSASASAGRVLSL